MKHTPGPWKIHDEGNTYPLEIFPAAGGTLIASVTKAANGPAGITQEVGRANASLIAAAPELLELLKQFVSDIEERDPIYPTWIDAARAAIAKAENC